MEDKATRYILVITAIIGGVMIGLAVIQYFEGIF